MNRKSVHWYPKCQSSNRLMPLMRNFLMRETRFIFWVLRSSFIRGKWFQVNNGNLSIHSQASVTVGSPASVLSSPPFSCLLPSSLFFCIVRADMHTASMFVPGGIDRTLRHMLFMIDGHPSSQQEAALGAWPVRWEGFMILMPCFATCQPSKCPVKSA